MEKNDTNFGVALDECLEVTGIRQPKVDATEQLTNETLLEPRSSEIVLIVS